MRFKPQPPQGVLHHVPHDPVRREELCRGGNFFFGDFDVFLQTIEHGLFRLGVVILVHPADDLYCIFPVIFVDVLHKASQDAVLFEDIVRQEHFGVGSEFFEHLRQGGVQRVALGEQKVAVELRGLVGV